MNLTYTVLPSYVHGIAHLLFLPLLLWALRRAPWRRLRNQELLHVFLGGCVMLLLLWGLKAGIKPGLHLHLLGATLFVLMFDWALALVGISLVLLGSTMNGAGDWISFSSNALLMGGLPIALSHGILRAAVRYLPHHFFVYVIVNAFFCAGLAMAIVMLMTSLLLGGWGTYNWERLSHDYLPFMPFMMFGEGFMTGMLVTGMALMKPEWLATFDDRRYIAGK